MEQEIKSYAEIENVDLNQYILVNEKSTGKLVKIKLSNFLLSIPSVSEWTYAEVNISKSQIENMGSTPIELLPALNTNEYYDINKIALEYTYGTVPYTLENDHLAFNNYSAYIHKTLIIVPFNTAIIASNNSGGLLDTIDTNLALQNQINGIGNNVELTTYNNTNPTGGDGTLKAKIWYKIITFG